MCQLRDVEEGLEAVRKLHKRSKIHNAHHTHIVHRSFLEAYAKNDFATSNVNRTPNTQNPLKVLNWSFSTYRENAKAIH